MAKRIVKRTIFDGKDMHYAYIVQSNRRLGFIPCKWHTIRYFYYKFKRRCAVFCSFFEACKFAEADIVEIVEESIKVKV